MAAARSAHSACAAAGRAATAVPPQEDLGDLSTLADPVVVDAIKRGAVNVRPDVVF